MYVLSFFFSPAGRLAPRPFIKSALAVYLLGAASQYLTTANVIQHGGLLPFIAVQLALVWIWFCLHARRLHDAGRSSGLAVGIGLLYLLSVVLLLIIADGFFVTSSLPLGDANAGGALWLIMLLYIVNALAGSAQYDLTWIVVAILIFMTFVPVIVALICTVWSARLPSVEATTVEASAEAK
ncbi:MAG TPA: hypothetical protein VMA30_09250 [Xanthobacteraceae bacterium]|nr:hypothetical protein [Xanthobacteraceae bacterium]